MENQTKRYWKGLEELRNDETFVKNAHSEFGSFETTDSSKNKSIVDGIGSDRRDFLKVLGFGVAAVSLAACEAPVRKAVPYLNKPVDTFPSIADWYASTYAGTATTDPAFGLPAHWIDDRQKEAAQMAGFTVVDSETVMATHLSHLMQVQAAKLLSRTETQQLVEHVAKLAPKLIEEVVPKMVSIATFQKVLQLLLEESVHIRDIRTIIETLAEHAGAVSDPVELARRVRIALSPAIVQQIYGPTRELNVIAIEPGLERLLVQALGNTAGPALDPGVADILTQKAAEVALKQEEMGLPACLLVPDQIRNAISRLVRRVAPRLQVLAHSEIPETHTIRIGPILKGASA